MLILRIITCQFLLGYVKWLIQYLNNIHFSLNFRAGLVALDDVSWQNQNLTWETLKEKVKGLKDDIGIKIDLSGNELQILEPNHFKSFGWIEIILDDNRDVFPNTTVTVLEIDNVEILHCENCDVKVIVEQTFSGLPKLRQLYLSKNSIEKVSVESFKYNKNISLIDFSYNLLKAIPMFPKLKDLYSLDLSHNEQLSIDSEEPVLELEKLETLKLSNCNITTIYEKTFLHVPNIKYLHLNDNNIKVIAGDAFVHFKQLKKLAIENNNPLLLSSEDPHVTYKLSMRIDLRFDFNKTISTLSPATAGPSASTKTISTAATYPITTAQVREAGINDAFISSYLILMICIQAGLVAVIFVCIIKVKRFEEITTMDYSSTIQNDNDVYKVYLK